MIDARTRGIRLAVVDDNPHVTWEGRTYAVDATFHRFLSAFLDIDSGVASIDHCVPLRIANEPPATLPTDARLRTVGTAPFDGIAGYLRHAPRLVRHNARILGPVISSADLVWIKVPASNALLGGWLSARAGIPRFGYVAGSALAVARGRGLGLPAQAIGLAYDVAGRAAGGGDRVVVGEGIVEGDGIVTSLVEKDEIRPVSGRSWPIITGRLRLSWAGRLVLGKGLEVLLDAVAMLVAEEYRDRIELVILGEGPSRSDLQARATRLGIADRVHWLGYVADRVTYLDALAACDLFVFPSPAEGFPKVALDAMAVGLPVLATPTGSLRELAAADLIMPVGGSPEAVVAAVKGLVAEPSRAGKLRDAGTAFAAKHTRTAEAERLVDLWRDRFSRLPWPARN